MRHYTICILFLLMCLGVSSARADFSYLWCDDADEVSAAVDPGNGDITLYHDAALYNCCPEPPVFTVVQEDGILHVWEQVDEAAPCDCNCCYDLQVTVADVTAGEWTVVYGWFDLETGAPVEVELTVSVPDVGAGSIPAVFAPTSTECLASSTVTDDEDPFVSWGALKGRYR